MGHQLAGALAAAALTVAACGGADEASDPPPVLENARELVAEARERGVAPDAPAEAADAGATVDELPPPDPATYVGAQRVVNLWLDADGEGVAVDVWGRRTFTTGPILLAADVGYGEASDVFSAPPEYELSVVGAGAGPDAPELFRILNTVQGERLTTVLGNDDVPGSVAVTNLWESGDDAPGPPASGTALVVVVAPNTTVVADGLRASIGSDSFYVGDGEGGCRRQRIEDDGFQPEVLGGASVVELETPPGLVAITLHPWPSPGACAEAAAGATDVTVTEGEARLVVAHSRDGAEIEWLTLSMDVGP